MHNNAFVSTKMFTFFWAKIVTSLPIDLEHLYRQLFSAKNALLDDDDDAELLMMTSALEFCKTCVVMKFIDDDDDAVCLCVCLTGRPRRPSC